ncbi:CdaR family protein [Virgibacillus ainsalahensis]
MDNWFKSKWFIRVLSLAFAILLYVFVNVEVNTSSNDSTFSGRSDEVQTLDEVPLDIRMDQENYVVSGVPEFVSVSLEGSQAILTPTTIRQNFDVYVDLQGLDAGEHLVEIEYENMPTELEVYIEPKTIEVEIEERETQEFQVGAEFLNTDEMPDGYELGEHEVDPESVTITSSQSVIDQIGMVNVYIDVAEQDEAINSREVPVNVYDRQGNELDVRVEPENVEVSAEIDNPSKTVPVNVATTGELAEGYEMESISATVDEAEIFARSSILEEIEEVSTEEIDLSEITESGTIETSLALPDGAIAPDMETIEVEVELEQTATFEDVPVEEQGLGEEQNISFTDPATEEMDITVTGDASEVGELSPDDFGLSINLNEMVAGEHLVPVTIEGPDSENLTITGEYEEIAVEIN